MGTRSLVLEAPQTVHVLEVPTPNLGAGEVRLQTLACGICGSDLRYYVGDNPWSQHTLGRQETVAWGRTILGHEVCARVVEVGRDVASLQVSDLVAVLPSHPCGHCGECRSGMLNLCQNVSHLGHGGGWPITYDRIHFPGAMADTFVYFANACHTLPHADVSHEEFALADMVGVAVHAVKRAGQVRARGLGYGCQTLVVGCGQVGLSIAQVARDAGAHVVGVDTGETARRIACAVDIRCEPTLEAVTPEDHSQLCFDVVFDTVCTPDTLAGGLNRLAAGGAMVILAPHEMEYGIPPLSVGGERAITTSCNFDIPDDFQTALRLIAERRVDLRPYITRRVSLTDAPEAFAALHTERDRDFKVVITP